MSEPTKIEPYYQAQAKQLVDCLFDKGFLSDTLNREGMDDVQGLLSLCLQLGAQSAAKCAEMAKKYKATAKGRQEGEDQPRHEEEMRWIARAKEAEALVANLSIGKGEVSKWAIWVGAFLKEVVTGGPAGAVDIAEASRLFTEAIALGIIPEPLGFAAARCADRPQAGIAPSARFNTCPKCGGRKI